MSLAKSMEILKIRESPLQNQWKLSKNANALRKNYMFMNSESGGGGITKKTKHLKKTAPGSEFVKIWMLLCSRHSAMLTSVIDDYKGARVCLLFPLILPRESGYLEDVH
jgi:hypothetical protein